jgi:hypothetical protein
MGIILEVSPRERVHAEARRMSFVIYDDFGKGFSLELGWDDLAPLQRLFRVLKQDPPMLAHVSRALAALEKHNPVTP